MFIIPDLIFLVMIINNNYFLRAAYAFLMSPPMSPSVSVDCDCDVLVVLCLLVRVLLFVFAAWLLAIGF